MSSPIKAREVHHDSSPRPVSYSPRHSSPLGAASYVANANQPARSSLLAQARHPSRPSPPPPAQPSFNFEHERYSSSARLIASWEETARKYVDVQDDDEIDLRTGRIVKDRGKLRNMDAVRYFGDDPLSSEDEQEFIDVDADDLGGWDATQFERGAVKDEADSEDDRAFFALPAPPMKSKRNVLDEEDLKQFMREENHRKEALGSDVEEDGVSAGSGSGSDAESGSDASRGAGSEGDATGSESGQDFSNEDQDSGGDASDGNEASDQDPSEVEEESDEDPLASSPAPSENLRRSKPSVEPLKLERRTSSLLSRPSHQPVKPARRRRRTSYTRMSDGSSSDADAGALSDEEYAPEDSGSDREDERDDDIDIDLLDGLPSTGHHKTSVAAPSRLSKSIRRSPLSPPPSQSPPPGLPDTKPGIASARLSEGSLRSSQSHPRTSSASHIPAASSISSSSSRPLPPTTLSATAHLRPFFYQPSRPNALPPSSSNSQTLNNYIAALPTPPLSTASSTSSSSAFSLPISSLNPQARRVRFEAAAEEEEDMSPLRPTRKSLHRKTSRDEIKPLISRAYADELKGVEILDAYRVERRKRKREERLEGKGKKSRKRGKMGLALVDETSDVVGGAENAVEDRLSSEEREPDPDRVPRSREDEDGGTRDARTHPSSKRRRIVNPPSVEPGGAHQDPFVDPSGPPRPVALPRRQSHERTVVEAYPVKKEGSPRLTVPGPRRESTVKLEPQDPSEMAIVELSKLAEDIAGPRKPRQRDMTERTFLTTPTLMDSLKMTIALLQLRKGTTDWGKVDTATGGDAQSSSSSRPSLPSGPLPSCANCILHDRPPELANACLGRLHLPTVLPLPDLAHTHASPAAPISTAFCSFLDMAPLVTGSKPRRLMDAAEDEPFDLDAYIASLPDASGRASSSSRSYDADGEVGRIKRRSGSSWAD